MPRAAAQLLAAGLLLVPAGVPARGCPFCTALRPTLAERIASAQRALVGEVVERDRGQPLEHQVRELRRLVGEDRGPAPTSWRVSLEEPLAVGTLAFLWHEPAEAAQPPRWQALKLTEIGFAYLAQAPALRAPAAERLAYFARFLEHPDPLVADDAYQEFARAPYDQVAAAAPAFRAADVRHWLANEGVPPERKGLYGLLLGLTARSPERQANHALVREWIEQPVSDFRAGFDGILGGYLVGWPAEALDEIQRRYLAAPAAAEGDVRHALAALRFYREYGRDLPAEALDRAAEQLLARPSLAAEVIVDLGRWQSWDAAPRVAALYDGEGYPQPATRRAVVGYLEHCPTAAGQAALDALRRRDPEGVAEAQRYWARFQRARE